MTDTVSDTAPTKEQITTAIGEWTIEHYTDLSQLTEQAITRCLHNASAAERDGSKGLAKVLRESAIAWTDLMTQLRLLYVQLPEEE